MRAFLESVVRALVEKPDSARVEVLDGRRATRFLLHVDPEDRGQVIGKEGLTIRALRTLVEISAHRHRRRFEVEIPD